MTRSFALSVLLLVALAAWPARAQVGDDGELVDFRVDASQGPISGSTRVVGLGGAYVAIAEGAEGTAKNPAAVAVRRPFSRHTWDYATSVDFAFGGWLPETDFLNQRDQSADADVQQKSLLFGSLAANVYYEHAGVGASAEARHQALESENASSGLAPTSLAANYGVMHASLAYGFYAGQLVLGAGPRLSGLSLNGGSELFSVAGIGSQVGAVIKPNGQPFRVGVVAKSAVTPGASDNAETPTGEQARWRPAGVTLPWEFDVGVAYQFGPRPLNPAFLTVEQKTQTLLAELRKNVAQQEQKLREALAQQRRTGNPETQRDVVELKAQLTSAQTLLEQAGQQAETSLRQQYNARPRQYLLVSAELMVLGSSGNSVGVGSVVSGVVESAGDKVGLSPRLGLESEVIAERLILRAGSYLEPARSGFSNARLHATFGGDIKLFHWDVFGLIGEFDGWTFSTAVDGAKNYLNTSFSIVFWH